MKRVIVMMVDDESFVLERNAKALQSFGDLEIITENDPTNVIPRLDNPTLWPRGYPEIFVLDYDMPKMSGDQLSGNIRQHPRFKNTPIIFFTGSNVLVTRKEVEDAKGKLGGEEFRTKGQHLALERLRQDILERTRSRGSGLQ